MVARRPTGPRTRRRGPVGHNAVYVFSPATGTVVRLPAIEVAPLTARPVSSDEQRWRACRPGRSRSPRMASRLLPAAATSSPAPSGGDPAPGDRARPGPTRDLRRGRPRQDDHGWRHRQRDARPRPGHTGAGCRPKGVQLQWVAEMADRFGEDFVRVGPEGLPVDSGVDPWRAFDRIVASLDAVKPVRARAGWTPEQVRDYNALRFRRVIDAGWDLVVIDEAHHVAGSSDEVARHRLARGLAQTVPPLLCCQRHRTRGRVRTSGGSSASRTTRSCTGARSTARRSPRSWPGPTSAPQSTTRAGPCSATASPLSRRCRTATGSSTGRCTRRSATMSRPGTGTRYGPGRPLRIPPSAHAAARRVVDTRHPRRARTPASHPRHRSRRHRPQETLDDWDELSGDEQLDAVDRNRRAAWDGEINELRALVAQARRTRAANLDPKAVHLLTLLRRLEAEEGTSELKAVIFTEFRPTQEMLVELLRSTPASAPWRSTGAWDSPSAPSRRPPSVTTPGFSSPPTPAAKASTCSSRMLSSTPTCPGHRRRLSSGSAGWTASGRCMA